MKKTISLNDTELKQALKIMMAESNISSMASLSREVGIVETTFRSAVNKSSLRISDLIKVCETMGYEVVIKDKNR